MEPVLNRAEIANLLKAIKDGKVPLGQEEQEQENFLPSTPINIFQLTRPDNEQFRIPNFDIILDNFSRMNGRSLTQQLQSTFTITRTRLETFEFQKFMADKHNPGAIGILDLFPLKYGALIMLDSALSFSMLEMMLGASADLDSPHLDRRLTPIELNILKTVIADACSDLDKAFAPLLELNTALIKLENNARLVSIVEGEAEVIVGSFLVKAGTYSGEIHLVFPFATLEPLRQQLKDLLNISTVTQSAWQEILEDEMQDIAATITAQSGTIDLTVKQVLCLEPGDIMPIEYDPSSAIKVLVENHPKFTAIPGTHKGKKAISLTGAIS
jgi:flagellar motor switch protein FliM